MPIETLALKDSAKEEERGKNKQTNKNETKNNGWRLLLRRLDTDEVTQVNRIAPLLLHKMEKKKS